MHTSSPPLDYPRIKVLAVGDAGVGKSCLIKRYCEGRFVAKYVPTIGIDYGVKKVEVKGAALKQQQEREGTVGARTSASSPPSAVRVNFWDASGSAEALEIRNEFYTATQGILFVFDVRDPDSFKRLDQWYAEVAGYINLDGANVPRRTSTTTGTAAGVAVGEVTGKAPVIVLLGNKVDDVVSAFDPTQGGSPTSRGRGTDRVVSTAQAQDWASRHGCLAYYDVSASSDLNVTAAVEQLFYAVMARFM